MVQGDFYQFYRFRDHNYQNDPRSLRSLMTFMISASEIRNFRYKISVLVDILSHVKVIVNESLIYENYSHVKLLYLYMNLEQYY